MPATAWILQSMTLSSSNINLASKNVEAIQVWRGIAALLVVFYHAAGTVAAGNWTLTITPLLARWGNAGVDIFFVISGFLMIATTSQKTPGLETARNFMRARIQRIVPLYWILTTLFVLLLLLAPALFKSAARFELFHTVSSYLFIPFNNANGSPYPVLYVGWTLTYEFFFYIVFAVLLCFTRKYIFPIVSFLFLTLSLLGLWKNDNLVFQTLTSPLMLEFVFGCTIGILYLNGVTLSHSTCLMLIAVSVVLLCVLAQYGSLLHRFIYYGLPSALLIAGSVFMERCNKWPRIPLLQMIGNSSYSLYLTHVFTLPAILKFLGLVDGKHDIDGDVVAIIAIIGTVVAGYMTYKLLEQPIERYLRDKYKARKIGGTARPANF